MSATPRPLPTSLIPTPAESGVRQATYSSLPPSDDLYVVEPSFPPPSSRRPPQTPPPSRPPASRRFDLGRIILEERLRPLRRVPVVPNRHGPIVEIANNEWVWSNGLVSGEPAFEKFSRIGCGSFAAHTYPSASEELTTIAANLISWLFLFDDFHGEGWKSPTEGHLQVIFGRCERVIREEKFPTKITPFYMALWGLRNRLANFAGAEWLERFADSLCSYFEGCRLEYHFRVQKTPPSLAEYRALRTQSIGAAPVFDLIEIGLPSVLPPERAKLPAVLDLRDRAAKLCAWTNDLYSYEKEHAAGDPLNLIEVLVHESGLSVDAAFAEAVATYNRELSELEQLVESFSSLPDTSSIERRFAAGLLDWVNGNTAWTPTSGRY